jgi:CO/xanthine dehydrogenase FAD-binding subunit
MQPFDYYKPKDFKTAFEMLALPGKTVIPYAGGTDVIPMYRDELLKMDAVVDVKELPGMTDIKDTPEGLLVGAAVRMADIAESALVKSHWNILAEGAGVVGSEQVRHRATIGGNICTASPAADTPPALFVLEAIVILRSAKGERRIPVTDFFKWVRRTDVQKGEMVVAILLPKPPAGSAGAYIRLSRRKGSDLSIVSSAAFATPKGKGYSWRIALGAVAPTCMRVPSAEAILAEGHSEAQIKKAAEAAAADAKPISDVRSGERYRRLMVAQMTRRAIESVAAKLK